MHTLSITTNTDRQISTHPHPLIFEQIDADLMRSEVLHIQGGAGPSGIDAQGWRRLCTSFRSASTDLCNSLASFARCLCTVDIEHQYIKPYLANRLIPLDKNPGVRPIGISEVMRRIISNAILRVISNDIQEAAGTLQLCAGHCLV